MSLILGIDAGGTFTDSVILDLADSRIMAKAKALTTKEDYTVGIRNSIKNLTFSEYEKISMVSLSTTLATNAIVENKGCEVGLIIIGPKKDVQAPVIHKVLLEGGHNIHGKPIAELNLKEVENGILSLKDKVDAVAISSYLSIRNPDHENRVKKMVKKLLGIPVVCSHELTTTLGYQERTVTAVLNAQLMPIIGELNEAVKKVLKEFKITDHLMVVKGDGSLMSDELAQEKPIETLLSGPAASIIGATFLTKGKDAIILDMGGTTTDIAIVENGAPKINIEGANVGNYLTRVQAADISTFGLGGDSCVQITSGPKIRLGPQKVCPLAYAASLYPALISELQTVYHDNIKELYGGQVADCFIYQKESAPAQNLNKTEGIALDLIKQGPRTLYFFSKQLDSAFYSVDFNRLVNLGIITRASLTPTDILHAKGALSLWDSSASKIGAMLLANVMGHETDAFLDIAFNQIICDTSLNILQSIVNSEENDTLNLRSQKGAAYFTERAIALGNASIIKCALGIKYPIIAIGAPVEAYLPDVSKRLNAQLIIPEHSEVANAVGAASGNIREKVNVLIRPDASEGYIVYAPWKRISFDDIEVAKRYAAAKGKDYAARYAKRAGAHEIDFLYECEDVYSGIGDHISGGTSIADKVYIESRIEVVAIGRTKWKA